MIVLADNDILLKLARCDLFDEFLAVFEVKYADILVLKTARFSITSKKHRKRIGEESFDRLTRFLSQVADINAAPDPKAITALTEMTDKNIDAGEAALYAVCPLIPNSIIVTGDKRSLVGLAASADDPLCSELCQSLAGKVVSFEQVLRRILDKFGYNTVREKLIEGRECDGGLALWLGSGLDATEERFSQGLTSYLNDLRQMSGSLLSDR